jgi:YD repeat-containing protein
MAQKVRVCFLGAIYHVIMRGNECARLQSQTDAPPSGGGDLTTTNGYDDLGRVLTVTLPDSTVTTNEYYLTGLLKKTAGSQTYMVEYAYDPQGRMSQMTTWQDATAFSSTVWAYDGQRGWLNGKIYPDFKTTEYTYTPAGRLDTRKWAREVSGSRLLTTYTYNTAGDLSGVDYADSTPDVTTTYTRWGQPEMVTDATGTRTQTYDPNLRPKQEILPSAYYGGRLVTRQYDGLGRSSGFQVGVTSNLSQDYAVTYGYDNAGRMSRVQDANHTWTYGFLSNSNLVSGVTNGVTSVTYGYEAGRDLITSLENKSGSTTVSHYTYANNRLGQRTERSQSGSAFTAAATETFGYNGTGELISSTHSADTTRDTSFAYDGIGNRQNASFGGVTTAYTANGLNQYASITASLNPITPSYDTDGNMTSDGASKTLVYDGENRLIEVRDASNALIATYTYDGQSRRVRKTTTSAAPQGVTDEVYLYDGWNRVVTYAVQNSTLSLQNCFTWGRDLSGSLQGAGGVGGLLSSITSSPHPSVTYHYDANGNVSEAIDNSGNIVAHYEYDAFGNNAIRVSPH